MVSRRDIRGFGCSIFNHTQCVAVSREQGGARWTQADRRTDPRRGPRNRDARAPHTARRSAARPMSARAFCACVRACCAPRAPASAFLALRFERRRRRSEVIGCCRPGPLNSLMSALAVLPVVVPRDQGQVSASPGTRDRSLFAQANKYLRSPPRSCGHLMSVSRDGRMMIIIDIHMERTEVMQIHRYNLG